MNMPRIASSRPAFLTIALFLSLAPPLCARQATTHGARAPLLTAGQWQADLDSLLSGLRQTHRNVFHTVTPARFDSAAAALRGRLPGLQRHEVIMEFARLASLVGDGHTNVAPTRDAAIGFQELPVAFYVFEEGMFIRAARRELAELAGARVLRIGDASAAEALARVTPYIGRDNAMGALYFAPHLLAMPEVLHALGLAPSPDSARLELEVHGAPRVVWLRAAGPAPLMPADTDRSWRRREGWVDARDATPGQDPLWLRQAPDTVLWWMTTVPGTRVVYVQINQVRDGERELFETFVQRVFERLDRGPVDRLILDLRLNRGGNGELRDPLVRGLLKRPQVNARGRLFVLLGRGTWSAAQFLLDDLQGYSDAILVGEPSASRGNHYGDSRRIRLPNSGITARASTRWWQHWSPEDSRPWTAPEVSVPLGFADYRARRDPVLEAALHWKPRPPLAVELTTLLGRGDSAGAVARVRAVRSNPRDRYVDALQALLDAGAQLYRHHDPKASAAAFSLAAAEYPESVDAHLRTGLVQAELGRTDAARRSLERVLELEPGNTTARERLGALTGR